MKFIPLDIEFDSIEAGDFIYFKGNLHILVDVECKHFTQWSGTRYILVNVRTGAVYDDYCCDACEICEALSDKYGVFRVIKTKNIEIREIQ